MMAMGVMTNRGKANAINEFQGEKKNSIDTKQFSIYDNQMVCSTCLRWGAMYVKNLNMFEAIRSCDSIEP